MSNASKNHDDVSLLEPCQQRAQPAPVCAHQHPAAQEHAHSHHLHETPCCSPPPQRLTELEAQLAVADGIRTAIRITQMDCPTEEALIRQKLGAMSVVKSMDFNLMQRKLTVVHTAGALESVMQALRSLGFTPELPTPADQRAGTAPAPAQPGWPLALGGVAALSAELSDWLGWSELLAAALALLAVAACGLGTYKKGWIALRHGNLNINALMSIAVTGAMLIGQWPEAAMVMVLFTLAERIEAKSLDRARQAIQGLMQLVPDRARLQQGDGSWLEVEAEGVIAGSIVQVRPGERIALDGQIVRGRSAVNQAPITGESLPVDKVEGDPVFAGTINEAGTFDYRVTTVASDSTLARIIHAVEEAQGTKAPTQRFVDRFARIYTPLVFILALLVAVIPPLLLPAAEWLEWLYKALVLLVIACPCALVISTPVTIVSGLAAAARRGLLIKGGVYLEEGRKLTWLALDKTGTLTQGKPVLTDFAVIARDVSAEESWRWAGSLAGSSDHPVSQAIWTAAQGEGSTAEWVEALTALPGRGVQGMIAGRHYFLGNHRMVEELGCCSMALETELDRLERQGKTVVLLVDERQVLALFAVADTVKASSRQAVAELHQLGIKTVMLTGDNPHTAEAIALQVGIDRALGNQLPEDKLQAVVVLEKQGAVVGMVGDGINDAPALAQAHIGFAMGALGTDTAIETADVALMDDDLRKIPIFIRLSNATHRILVQNIALALGIKVIFLVLALMGISTMWMAVFADAGASLLVIGNGLRLMRYRV